MAEVTHTSVYDEFLEKYNSGNTTGEEVGEVIAKLAQFYSSTNARLVATESDYNGAYAALVQSTEENGKAISVSKAEVLAKATAQYNAYNESRKTIVSIEQQINALKSLQRGVLNEFAHVS